MDKDLNRLNFIVCSIDEIDRVLGRVIIFEKELLDVEWFAQKLMKLSYFQQKSIFQSFSKRYPETDITVYYDDDNIVEQKLEMSVGDHFALQIDELRKEKLFMEYLLEIFKNKLQESNRLLVSYKLNFLIEEYLEKCIINIKDLHNIRV